MHDRRLHFRSVRAASAADAASSLHTLDSPALEKLLARASLVERVAGEDFQRTLPHERWLARQFGATQATPRTRRRSRPTCCWRTAATPARKRGLRRPVHVEIAHDHLALVDPAAPRARRSATRPLLAVARPLIEERRPARGAEPVTLVPVERAARPPRRRRAVARERPQHRDLAAARGPYGRTLADVDEAAERSADGVGSSIRSTRPARRVFAGRQFDLVPCAGHAEAGRQAVARACCPRRPRRSASRAPRKRRRRAAGRVRHAARRRWRDARRAARADHPVHRAGLGALARRTRRARARLVRAGPAAVQNGGSRASISRCAATRVP